MADKLRRTLFLSEYKEAPSGHRYKYQAPYIFYDKHSQKWREDTWYFDNLETVYDEARKKKFHIA